MKRMSRPGTMFVAAAVATAGLAANLAWAQIDAAKSSVTATAKQIGVPMEGKFKKFDATVDFDPAKLDRKSVV